MTNKVITQTVVVTGTVLPADVITKIAETKEFMVIDYPRLGVDYIQTQQGSVIVDTAVKLLVHCNGDFSDSSSYLRATANTLQGGSLTFNASTPPTLGLGSNYIQIQGAASLSQPHFRYANSADLYFDGTSGQIWELAFRHQHPFLNNGRTYPVCSFGSSSSANFSSNPNKFRLYFQNPSVGPNKNLVLEFNTATSALTWDISGTNYSSSILNHILISCDGTTIRLFVNGVVHATTFSVNAGYESSTTATPLCLFTGGDTEGSLSITAMDEIQLKIGGTVTTASFTAPTTEYTGTTGTVTYTGNKCIIPKKRVLEFV